MSRWTSSSWKRRPIRRLIANKVLFGLVTAWRFAGAPTKVSPSSVNATTDGVVRSPSPFSITRGLPPSKTATHEFVVPKSMPMILPIINLHYFYSVQTALVWALMISITVIWGLYLKLQALKHNFSYKLCFCIHAAVTITCHHHHGWAQ